MTKCFEFDASITIEAETASEAANILLGIANNKDYAAALYDAGTLNVARYRAFVDELKRMTSCMGQVGEFSLNELLREYGMEDE